MSLKLYLLDITLICLLRTLRGNLFECSGNTIAKYNKTGGVHNAYTQNLGKILKLFSDFIYGYILVLQIGFYLSLKHFCQ